MPIHSLSLVEDVAGEALAGGTQPYASVPGTV